MNMPELVLNSLEEGTARIGRWLRTRPAILHGVLHLLLKELSQDGKSPAGNSRQTCERTGRPRQADLAFFKQWTEQWGFDRQTPAGDFEHGVELLFALLATLVTAQYLRRWNVAGVPHCSVDRVAALVECAPFGNSQYECKDSEFLKFCRWLGWNEVIPVPRFCPAVASSLAELDREVESILAATPSQVCLPGDVFRPIREALFPRPIRLSRGEFYTPWALADYIVEKIGVSNDFEATLFDPACGSGVFLTSAAWRRVSPLVSAHDRRSFKIPGTAVDGGSIREGKIAVESILTAVLGGQLQGVDIDPAAVLGARASLLLTAALLCRIFLPGQPISLGQMLQYETPVVHGDFFDLWASPPSPGNDCDAARDPSFPKRLTREKRFQFVVGNPPWLMWDRLQAEGRLRMTNVFRTLGLFDLPVRVARHGGGKRDCGVAFIGSAFKLLKDGGTLAMIVPVSLFHSQVAGRSFRLLFHKPDLPINIEEVVDLRWMSVFPGTIQRTAVLIAKKGEPANFPIRFTVWRPKTKGRSPLRRHYWDREHSVEELHWARAVSASDPGGPWILLTEPLKELWDQLARPSEYQAYLGANTGGANGVFWLEILGWQDTKVVVRNLPELGRLDVPAVTEAIEPELVFPLLRWKDVKPGASPCLAILLAQDPSTRRAWSEECLKTRFPGTYAYLCHFREALNRRAARRKLQQRGPWYSQYNVGPYTVSPWKVVWRRMDSRLRAVVVGQASLAGLPVKSVVPQETCCFVPAQNEAEAHYLAGVLNSPVIQKLIDALGMSGSRSFGTPSVLNYLGIPRFEEKNPVCQRLAGLHKAWCEDQDRGTVEMLGFWSELTASLYSLNKEAVRQLVLQDS